MNYSLTVSKSIDINVSPDKVWEGLTNPKIIKEYLFGTETITDWEVGSDVIFQGEYDDQNYRDKGIVMENIPEKLLSYTYWSGFSGLEDKSENYSLITYTLESSSNNNTIFTWSQKGFADEEKHEHAESGMQEFLEKIKEVIENIQN